MNRVDIEEYLCRVFHLQRVLWLDHGYLSGDDTDSHIDTLARFCSPDTIAYVKCTDSEDEHYEALCKMEEQLKNVPHYIRCSLSFIGIAYGRQNRSRGREIACNVCQFFDNE